MSAVAFYLVDAPFRAQRRDQAFLYCAHWCRRGTRMLFCQVVVFGLLAGRIRRAASGFVA